MRTARSQRPQVHPHRDHPARPLEMRRLGAPTRLARLCGIQWPLARLADDADPCAPFLRHCGEHPASHTHKRAGTEAGTARATARPTIEVRPLGLDTSGPGVSCDMARNDGREGTCSTTQADLAADLPSACARGRRTQPAVVSVGAPRSVGSAPALKRTPTSQLRRRFR